MTEPRGKKPGVRLSEDEAWEVVERAHTGVFTTLRRDGSPITLPVWFVVLERRIYLRTPKRTKKVARIKADPRASFLVECGAHWKELQAVHLTGSAALVADGSPEARAALDALDQKYAGYKASNASLSTEAASRYQDMQVVRFTPDARILRWDNQRLGIR